METRPTALVTEGTSRLGGDWKSPPLAPRFLRLPAKPFLPMTDPRKLGGHVHDDDRIRLQPPFDARSQLLGILDQDPFGPQRLGDPVKADLSELAGHAATFLLTVRHDPPRSVVSDDGDIGRTEAESSLDLGDRKPGSAIATQ